jgi:hypothetical protein
MSNQVTFEEFVSIDLNALALVAGGDGQESSDSWWGRRLGGVLGAVGGGTLGFLGGSAVTANPVGGVVGGLAGGATGQYAGEEYGARRGASGLATDVVLGTNPITGPAYQLYRGIQWLRGK